MAEQINFNNEVLSRVTQLEQYASSLELRLAKEQSVPHSSTIKVTLPDTYDGDSQKIGDWLFQVKNYLSLVRIPEHQHVHFAVALLRGTALSWWRIATLDAENLPQDFPAFELQLCLQFQVEDEVKQSRDLLARAVQTSTVQAYTAHFRSLLLKIKDMSEAEAKDRYVRGLKPRIQMEVILRDFKTPKDIIRFAERFDNMNQRVDRNIQQQRHVPAPAQAADNAMDVDALQVIEEKDPIQNPLENLAASVRVVPNAPNPRRPLTDVERRQLARNKACFYCRQPGHYKRDCPTRAPRPFQGNGVQRQ
jgi:hypothetical protein